MPVKGMPQLLSMPNSMIAKAVHTYCLGPGMLMSAEHTLLGNFEEESKIAQQHVALGCSRYLSVGDTQKEKNRASPWKACIGQLSLLAWHAFD